MYENWYKTSNKKRDPITIDEGESFDWESVRNIDGSYNIVTVSIKDKKFNFYLWSSKTVNSAHKLYKKSDFKKSLGMLKKYSFDLKVQE